MPDTANARYPMRTLVLFSDRVYPQYSDFSKDISMNRINTLHTSAIVVACSPIDSAYPPSLHPLLDHVCGRTIVSHIIHDVSKRVDTITLLVASAHLAESLANVLTDEPVTVEVGTIDEYLAATDESDLETDWLLFYDARVPLAVSSMLDTIEESDAAGPRSLWIDTSVGVAVIGVYVQATEAFALVPELNYPVDNLADLATLLQERSPLDVVDIASWAGDELRLDIPRERMETSTEIRLRLLEDHVELGVHIVDPYQTYVDVNVLVGSGTTLYPGTHLIGSTEIGENCKIGPYVIITDSTVQNSVHVGPFVNIRTGSTLEDKTKIGNFVELKNTYVGENSSAGHLSYLGDTTIGSHTNIGAGTVTCNYDGYRKHRTSIGSKAFIGSSTTLVAPVSVGNGAWTAAGSTITESVPPDGLGIARSRQSLIENWATKRRAALHHESPNSLGG